MTTTLTATEVIEALRTGLADELPHLSCSVVHDETIYVKAVKA